MIFATGAVLWGIKSIFTRRRGCRRDRPRFARRHFRDLAVEFVGVEFEAGDAGLADADGVFGEERGELCGVDEWDGAFSGLVGDGGREVAGGDEHEPLSVRGVGDELSEGGGVDGSGFADEEDGGGEAEGSGGDEDRGDGEACGVLGVGHGDVLEAHFGEESGEDGLEVFAGELLQSLDGVVEDLLVMLLDGGGDGVVVPGGESDEAVFVADEALRLSLAHALLDFGDDLRVEGDFGRSAGGDEPSGLDGLGGEGAVVHGAGGLAFLEDTLGAVGEGERLADFGGLGVLGVCCPGVGPLCEREFGVVAREDEAREFGLLLAALDFGGDVLRDGVGGVGEIGADESMVDGALGDVVEGHGLLAGEGVEDGVGAVGEGLWLGDGLEVVPDGGGEPGAGGLR